MPESQCQAFLEKEKDDTSLAGGGLFIFGQTACMGGGWYEHDSRNHMI